jgi:hypothetical protein
LLLLRERRTGRIYQRVPEKVYHCVDDGLPRRGSLGELLPAFETEYELQFLTRSSGVKRVCQKES